jgi:hypothetical protein
MLNRYFLIGKSLIYAIKRYFYATKHHSLFKIFYVNAGIFFFHVFESVFKNVFEALIISDKRKIPRLKVILNIK